MAISSNFLYILNDLNKIGRLWDDRPELWASKANVSEPYVTVLILGREKLPEFLRL